MNKTYQVNGMSCVICKANVEKSLNKVTGVNSAIVSLMDNEVVVDYDENIVNEAFLAKAVKDAGYELIINPKKQSDTSKYLFLSSIILSLILMVISMTSMHSQIKTMYIQLIITTIIIIINNHYFVSGFKALFKMNPNMDSLVALSSSISYLYSIFAMFKIAQNNSDYHLYFEACAMVLTIVTIGKRIEGLNKKKTTRIIRGLSTLIPMNANLIEGESIKIVPIEEIKKGDVVLVKPGDSIPQDGIVIEGNSTIDESLITGESLPSIKTIDSKVIGGTVNIDGQLIIKITSNANQTLLAKIVSLTKQASMTKIPIERFADKIAKYFVFGVIIISLLTFIIWLLTSKNLELALNFALSVLVISCPCALGLATPSAITVACGVAGKNGLLIKNPEVLELAYKTKNIILDKTGTISENKLNISKIVEYDKNFIDVLSSLERNSNHPIAKVINETYGNGTMNFSSLTQISGEGIEADDYYAGNEKLLNKHGIFFNQDDLAFGQNNNYSYIGVGHRSKLLGIVYLEDKIKDSSHKAINNFNNQNINTIMCTGDNKIVAEHVSKLLNIKEYHAEITPQDKQDILNAKKENGITMMVGDGINDAVALSSADIAVSLQNGSDIASASSDIILMHNNLNDLNYLFKLSKKTITIIKENLFWSLFYNGLFIPLAAGLFYNHFGLRLSPLIGSITMTISSIIVLSNALRIHKVKKEEN